MYLLLQGNEIIQSPLSLELGWEDLPEELLWEITCAGGIQSMRGIREVYKSWQAGFDSNVSHITVSKKGPTLPFAQVMLVRFPFLRGICLNCSQFSAFSKYDLRVSFLGLPLTRLELSYCNAIHISGLEVLRQMPLATLRIRGGRYGVAYANPGNDRTGLHSGCLNPNEVLASLRGKHLTSLDLSNAILLANAGQEFALGVLRGMPLTTLNLGGCYPRLKDEELEFLRELPLTVLVLKKATC